MYACTYMHPVEERGEGEGEAALNTSYAYVHMYVRTTVHALYVPTYVRRLRKITPYHLYIRMYILTQYTHTYVRTLRTYISCPYLLLPCPLLLAFLQGGYDAGFLYQYSMADQEVGQPAEPSEPKQSVPLPPFAGRDTPLTALTFRYSIVHMFVYRYVCMCIRMYLCMYMYVCMVRTV